MISQMNIYRCVFHFRNMGTVQQISLSAPMANALMQRLHVTVMMIAVMPVMKLDVVSQF